MVISLVTRRFRVEITLSSQEIKPKHSLKVARTTAHSTRLSFLLAFCFFQVRCEKKPSPEFVYSSLPKGITTKESQQRVTAKENTIFDSNDFHLQKYRC